MSLRVKFWCKNLRIQSKPTLSENPLPFWARKEGQFSHDLMFHKTLNVISFDSVALFGENNNSTISGIWAWRGQDLVFELSEDWQIDYSSYEWKKLDPEAAETKDLVNQYFSWTGTDKDGRKFNQGKIYK